MIVLEHLFIFIGKPGFAFFKQRIASISELINNIFPDGGEDIVKDNQNRRIIIISLGVGRADQFFFLFDEARRNDREKNLIHGKFIITAFINNPAHRPGAVNQGKNPPFIGIQFDFFLALHLSRHFKHNPVAGYIFLKHR